MSIEISMNKNTEPQMTKKSNNHLKKAESLQINSVWQRHVKNGKMHQTKAESLQINSVGQRPMKNRTMRKTTSPERA